jgi:hypothetical protein
MPAAAYCSSYYLFHGALLDHACKKGGGRLQLYCTLQAGFYFFSLKEDRGQ